MLAWGLMAAFFELRPFWRDEWCLIYNLKFKSANQLWGQLDFTQQFPRIYLQLIKWFSALFNYSYFSLRLPSYMVGIATVTLAYSLKDRVLKDNAFNSLFVLIIAANPMFIDYLNQVKHYEMELLMSVVAIYQLHSLLHLKSDGSKYNLRYVLLCTSFLLAPFFSYTYPIAVSPIYVIIPLRLLLTPRSNTDKSKTYLYQLAPLASSLLGCLIFYLVDVRQLLNDRNMYGFWSGFLVTDTTPMSTILHRIWSFFAKIGAGFVFEIIFSALAITALLFALTETIIRIKKRNMNNLQWMVAYASALPILVIIIYFGGLIPLGEAKFSAFVIPAFSLLLSYSLNQALLAHKNRLRKSAGIIGIIITLALAGNIITACLQIITYDQYKNQLSIYCATKKAIMRAKEQHIPLVVTNNIGYPDDITVKINFLSMPSAAGIAKTFPAYDRNDTIKILGIQNLNDTLNLKQRLQTNSATAILGDGKSFKTISIR